MKAESISPQVGLMGRVTQSVRREMLLSWQIVHRDIWTAVIPALMFIVAAWKSQPVPTENLVWALGRGSLYFYLYLLSFCLANQIVGIEEDRINKPDRPLVTGAVSYQGAILRWIASMVLFSLVAWLFGVFLWALLWQVFILVNNFGRTGDCWITKNLGMGFGAFVQLVAAWQLVTPITPIAWCWIWVAVVFNIFLAAVQDLRDIEGDRATNRKTFPITFGEIPSRIVLSIGLCMWPLVTHFGLMMQVSQTENTILWDFILAAISWSISVRIMMYRYSQADHHTYMVYSYLYCLMLVSAIFVI